MLNFEKYKTNIANICDTGDDIAIVNGIPVGCNTLYDCTECDFDSINKTCNYQLLKWATSEYEEPAPKLIKREREFLECFIHPAFKEIYRKIYGLYVGTGEPRGVLSISDDMFPFIKPGEVWTFEDLLKLEVEDEY